MKPLLFREVRRKPLRKGFVEVGQTGSHVKYVLLVPGGTITAVVPKHREVAAGTLAVYLGRLNSRKKNLTSSSRGN